MKSLTFSGLNMILFLGQWIFTFRIQSVENVYKVGVEVGFLNIDLSVLHIFFNLIGLGLVVFDYFI